MSALLLSISLTRSLMSDNFRLVVSVARSLSSVLVIMTFMFCASNSSFKIRAIFRLISFSKVPDSLTLPGSGPPCPASITMVMGLEELSGITFFDVLADWDVELSEVVEMLEGFLWEETKGMVYCFRR